MAGVASPLHGPHGTPPPELTSFFAPGLVVSGVAESEATGGGGGGALSSVGTFCVAEGTVSCAFGASPLLFIFQKISPPMSKSITTAARMNGPLPPDFGIGGVVSDIRGLQFRHQQVENRLLSAGDYSYPTDRARGFLRPARGPARHLEHCDGRITPVACFDWTQGRVFRDLRRLARRMLQHEPSGRGQERGANQAHEDTQRGLSI